MRYISQTFQIKLKKNSISQKKLLSKTIINELTIENNWC